MISNGCPPQVSAALLGPDFIDRTSRVICNANFTRKLDYAIALPVRNEAQWLPRALDSLITTMRASTAIGAVVCVVNDTQDNSASVVRSSLATAGVNFATLELSLAPDIRNAPHARRLALDVATRFSPDGVLLTTDADSYVGSNWLPSRLDRIAQGFDLVCEDVQLDDGELSLLPPLVRAVGDAERCYFEISERLWQIWTRGMAGSFAHRASGASLAVRSDAYRKVGGLPTPTAGEDSALCKAILAAGLNVTTSNEGGTRTSARLDGRAKGGCGDCLAVRSWHPNPLCDANLVPVSVLRKLATEACMSGESRVPCDQSENKGAISSRPMTYTEVLAELERARAVENELGAVDA